MTRWLPFPLLSACLLAMWLLLNQSLSPAYLLAGAVLAYFGPRLLLKMDSPRARIRRPGAVLRLLGLVLVDITRSNIAVARIILHRGKREGTSDFLRIPLRLRDPNGLAALACIITSTPGTLWVDYDSATGVLLLHVLDLVDDNAWIELITQRYERLLLEIFE